MMKAIIILTIIAVCSAFPAEDSIPPKDVQPSSPPVLPPVTQFPQLAEKPQLEPGLKGPQSAPGDKTQGDLKADHTHWFGYGYPYYRTYYTYYKPSVYSYDWSWYHWSPYYYW